MNLTTKKRFDSLESSQRFRTDSGTVMFALSFGVIAVWISTQWFIGSHSSYNGNNGDHLYYVAYAKLMNGLEYRDALATTAEFFKYQRPHEVLDYEWLDIAIAPLVYPRLVLSSLISVSIKVFGMQGVWVPSLTFGVLTHTLWWRLIKARVGNQIAGIIMLLISLSPQLTELRFGIYTEAPLLFLLTLWFIYAIRAFHPDTTATFIELIPLILLTPLIGLTRQSLFIPLVGIMALATHQIFSKISSLDLKKRISNVFLVLIWLLTWQILINKWAPYDSSVYAMVQNGVTNRFDLLTHSPLNFARIVGLESSRLLTFRSTFDPIFFLTVLMIPVVSVRIMGWRRSALLLCVTSICLITTILNGRATGFRYFVPVIPAFLCSISIPTNKAKSAEEDSSRRDRVAPYLLSSLCVIVALSALSTLMYKPTIKNWQPISSANLLNSWPLTVDSGFLGCSGHDFQVWFKTSEGKIYAVSGTALQRRLFVPSIEELSINKRDQLISPTRLLLRYGVRLCGAKFMTK